MQFWGAVELGVNSWLCTLGREGLLYIFGWKIKEWLMCLSPGADSFKGLVLQAELRSLRAVFLPLFSPRCNPPGFI